MSDKPFLDSNVVVYAFSKNDPRSQIAEVLLAAGCVLSVQVLNEFVAVARGKLHRSWSEIGSALAILRVFCPEPAPITLETHEQALQIAERYGYHIFDALMIAAALQAGCRTLYSENMHGGQAIQGMKIRNPFLRS